MTADNLDYDQTLQADSLVDGESSEPATISHGQPPVWPFLWELFGMLSLLVLNIAGTWHLVTYRSDWTLYALQESSIYYQSPELFNIADGFCVVLIGSWCLLFSWGIGRLTKWVGLKWVLLGLVVGLITANGLFSTNPYLNQFDLPEIGYYLGKWASITALLCGVWQWAILSQRSIVLRLGIALALGFAGLYLVSQLGSFSTRPESAFIWNQLCATIVIAFVLRIWRGQQLVAKDTPPQSVTSGHQFGLFTFLAVVTAVAIALNMARYFELMNWPNSMRVMLALLAFVPALTGHLAWRASLTRSVRNFVVLVLAAFGISMITPALVALVFLDPQMQLDYDRLYLWLRDIGPLWVPITTAYSGILAVLLRTSGLQLAMPQSLAEESTA